MNRRWPRLFWPLLIAIAIAIGLVYISTRVSLSVRVASVPLGFAATGFLAAIPGIATLSLVDKRKEIGSATALACVFTGSGIGAFASFWAWCVSPRLGELFSLVVLVGSIVATATGKPRLLRHHGLATPILLAYSIGLVYLGLAFMGGGIGNGANGYDVVAGQALDNYLPLLLAQHLAAHLSTHAPLVGDWLTSDRPPLQTGFVLLQYQLIGNQQFGYQLLGTALQMSWVPALWILLTSRALRRSIVFPTVILTALSPFVARNSIYVWPKMIAGSFLLVTLALLLDKNTKDQWIGNSVLAGACTALALLCHGGIAFSVIAMIPISIICARREHRWLAFATLSAVIVYLPWIGYQHFLDPPGNRLLKWQLAGFPGIDKRSFLQTIVDQYRSQPFLRTLSNKWRNFTLLADRPGMALRLQQQLILAWSLGPMLLGFYAIRHKYRERITGTGVFAVFVLVSLVVWAILMWGSFYESTVTYLTLGPYAAIVLVTALLAVGVSTFACPMRYMLFFAQGVWFTMDWWVRPASVDWQIVAVAAIGLAILASIVFGEQKAGEQPVKREMATL